MRRVPVPSGICHDGCVASVDSKLRVCHWQWKTPFVFQDFAVVAIAQQTLNISYDLEVNKYGGEREDHDEGPVCDTVLCSRTPTRTPCPSFKFFNLFERRLPFFWVPVDNNVLYKVVDGIMLISEVFGTISSGCDAYCKIETRMFAPTQP